MKRRMIMLGVAITVVVALSGCGKENKNAEIGTDIADTDAEWDDAGEDTVEEFAKEYIYEGDKLEFVNDGESQVSSISDPGKVETWHAEGDNGEYLIVVDLENGYISYYSSPEDK